MSQDNYKQEDLFSPTSENETKRLKSGKKLLFSYSKMSLYNECSLKYKFKYEDKLPEKPKYFFAFGRAVHEVLEFFHSQLPPPSQEQLVERFTFLWKKENYMQKGYPTAEKEQADFEKGLKLLHNYWQKHSKDDKLPFLLEYSTDVELDGLTVRIVADRIEHLGEGRIKILDYKTGKPADRTPEQLYMYQKILQADKKILEMAAEKLGIRFSNITVDSLLYYYVETLKEKNYPAAQEDEINKFWDKALKTNDAILSKVFTPNPGEKQCHFCDYKAYCPIFSEDKIERSENQIKQESDFNEGVLKRYLKLKIKEKELKDDIEKLENEIIKYPQDNLESKDSDFILTIEKKSKYEFQDREKIINKLKEFNLYDKILSPTLKAINELIEKGDISLKEKEELKACGEKKIFLDSQIKKKKDK